MTCWFQLRLFVWFGPHISDLSEFALFFCAPGMCVVRPRSVLKRYWVTDLWAATLSTLLNLGDTSAPPPWAELLARFEEHFAGNPAAGRKLRTELAKLVRDRRCV